MDTKLTLKLDKDVIERAKDYAKSHQTSLSLLIENYLSSLTVNPEKKAKRKVSSLVESLTGIIPDEGVKDYRSEYYAYLSKKYS